MAQHFAITLPEEGYEWHNEDVWAVSERYPIYAVADGITMPVLDEITSPSLAKRAADMFCKEATQFLSSHADRFSESLMLDAYTHANHALARLNQDRVTPLSTAATLVIIHDQHVIGSRIADCGWALVRRGDLSYRSPPARPDRYAILDGSRDIARYIDFHVIPAKPGDILVLYSDGFQYHFGERAFASLFHAQRFDTLKRAITVLDAQLVERDHARFGDERTLLAVKLF